MFAAAAALLPWAIWSLGEIDHTSAEALGFGLFVLLSRLTLLMAGIGLLANGAVVVRREGIRVATVVAPVAGLGLLVLSTAIRGVAHRGSGASDWLSISAGVIVLLGTYLLAQLLAYAAETVRYARAPRPTGSEVLIVLGCGLDGARVTPLLASRLDRAARLYRAEIACGGNPLVVTSGGQGPGETRAEADAMADYLVAVDIPPDRIVRERESRTTEENLRCSAAEIRRRQPHSGDPRTTVVTSDFHVLRAAILSRRLGLAARVVGGRTAPYFMLTAFLREFVAFLALHRRTNIVLGIALTAPAVLAVFA